MVNKIQYIALLFLMLIATNIRAQIAPDFTLIDVFGQSHNLYETLDEGTVVVLDFFYAECPPCQAAAPEIEAIRQDYEGYNVEIWSISDRDLNEEILNYHAAFEINTIAGGVEGGGEEIIYLYHDTFLLEGFPTLSVICNDTLMIWDIWPYTDGAPEWRDGIENCGVELTTATNEITATIDYTIAPNPAQERTQISLELMEQMEVSFTLFDLTGKAVLQEKKGTLVRGNHDIMLNISDLTSGIYYLEVSSAKQILVRDKLVIGK